MKIIYKEKVIEVDPKKTILENLEKAEAKPYSMCREGYCATCKMTLIEGNVEYLDDPIAILDDNEFLPCICKATSDIKIDY
jgi:ferredoxin